MLRKILLAALLVLPTLAFAAHNDDDLTKYMAGAVPVKNGIVVFEKNYKVPGKSEAEIYSRLHQYANKLVRGENSLPQSRILEADSLKGLLAVNMEEWLYFKKTAWSTDRARLFYQLNFRIEDGKYSIEMVRLRYLYEDERYNRSEPLIAEDWITDANAIKKNGKGLTKTGGKFRRFTIDRKNQIFTDAAKAAGALRTVRKVVVEEVEE